jgi:lysozyme family protein
MQWSPALEAHYLNLYRSCQLTPGTTRLAEEWANTLGDEAIEARYRHVSAAAHHCGRGCGFWPWWLIAILHELEGSSDFDRWLCNGDPLSHKTESAPAGLGPCSSWEDAAVESIAYHANNVAPPPWGDLTSASIRRTEPNVAECCFVAERWNGFGYLVAHPGINSPYLWGRTNHHHYGKYINDGEWSPMAETKQLGFVPLMHAVMRSGIPGVVADEPTWVIEGHAIPDWPIISDWRYGEPEIQTYEGLLLQRFMNANATGEPPLMPDGLVGPQTRRRYLTVFGHPLR